MEDYILDVMMFCSIPMQVWKENWEALSTLLTTVLHYYRTLLRIIHSSAGLTSHHVVKTLRREIGSILMGAKYLIKLLIMLCIETEITMGRSFYEEDHTVFFKWAPTAVDFQQ